MNTLIIFLILNILLLFVTFFIGEFLDAKTDITGIKINYFGKGFIIAAIIHIIGELIK